MAGKDGFDQVLPLSDDVLCMMPLAVRANIHSALSFCSMIMCSCQLGFGNRTHPRRCQLAPLSVETKTLAPRIGSSSWKHPLKGPNPPR